MLGYALAPCALALSVAGPTRSATFRSSPVHRVRFIERVALDAVSLLSLRSIHDPTDVVNMCVLARSHQLKMRDVHARFVAAAMMDEHPVWDRPVDFFPRYAVSVEKHAVDANVFVALHLEAGD